MSEDVDNCAKCGSKVIDANNVHVLTLKHIAAWQFPKLVACDPMQLPIIVGIPSLQRGAVWKPAQIELIWDSIFRGFPVGALVVCDILRNQDTRSGKYGEGWKLENLNRHLLDGQQRCNAIALGFSDPFSDDPPKTMLWLDINRQKFTDPKITRQYLFRVTTLAHPWGYKIDDNAKPVATLSASDVRTALNKYKWTMDPADEKYERPPVDKVWPYIAEAPVPLSWLLAAADEKLEGDLFWKRIQKLCESRLAHDGNALWASSAIDAIKNNGAALLEIEKGISRALDLHVVALQVPNDSINAATLQEESAWHITSEEPQQNISNVEHLFQRLNRGGTVLDGPELAYSMIKAYMPGIENEFEKMPIKPMVYSSLALLGTRAALAQHQPEKLPTALSVGQLRALAQGPKFETAKEYFGLLSDTNTNQPNDSSLERVIGQVDKWLLWDDAVDKIGLPPVLRTNLAQRTPDIYLLLMVLARQALVENKESNAKIAALRQPVLGLATALNWFGVDRPQAVEKLYAHFSNLTLCPEAFADVLKNVRDLGKSKCGVMKIQYPETLREMLKMPDVQQLEAWRWKDQLIVKPAGGDEKIQWERNMTLWPFIERLKSSKDLLIYAQRELMAKRFRTFDPAMPEALEDHNRPWDYDHILPQDNFTNLKPAPKFMGVCKEWGWTIANLHILRFEENRSVQAGKAINKISDDTLALARMDKPHDLRSAFSLTKEDLKKDIDQNIVEFVNAARNRLLEIYTDWFETLNISFLIGK